MKTLLSDLTKLLDSSQDLESILADGCYHGFKDASKCPNDHCPEREVRKAWDALMDAAQQYDDLDPITTQDIHETNPPRPGWEL